MNINLKYINKVNDVIKYKLKFYSASNLSSFPTKDPLTIITVSLRGDKKSRSTVVSRLNFLWGSGATGTMIKVYILSLMIAR